jgi:hypothetical protein
MSEGCSIVSIKAYGDFVIACSALRFYGASGASLVSNIYAGEYVRSLAQALAVEERVTFIGEALWADVPAAFDIRKRGLIEGLLSLRQIRELFAGLPNHTQLVFDHLGWRERYIGRGLFLNGLPKNVKNIYLAYEKFFRPEAVSFETSEAAIHTPKGIRDALIIPSARLSHKVLPPSLITSVTIALSRFQIRSRVLLLRGDNTQIPSGVEIVEIPRQFEDLVATIKESQLVISADSLPAHLTGFFSVPVFVFARDVKWSEYWLPKSAFSSRGFSSFTELLPLYSWLESAISQCSSK